MRARCVVLLMIGCSSRSAPVPVVSVAGDARPPAEEADVPIPELAIHGPVAPRPSAPPRPQLGVRWRAAIPGAMVTGFSTLPPVVGDEVFVSQNQTVAVYDLATGALRRHKPLAHGVLATDGVALIADGVPIDPKTFAPTGRAPAREGTLALGRDWILELSPATELTPTRLRRASDGGLVWAVYERVERAVLAGDVVFVQLARDQVAALELATGAVRWRTSGRLGSTSGDLAVVERPGAPPASHIVDAAGRTRWTADAAAITLRGTTAYAATGATLTAIELPANRVKWRRDGLGLILLATDDAWLYGWTQGPVEDSTQLTILSAETGETATQLLTGMQTWQGEVLRPVPGGGAVLVFGSAWVFALGPVAGPEPTRAIDARGCLAVEECYGHSDPLPGARVTIGGTTAITDRRGCFKIRAQLGTAPVAIAVTDPHPTRVLDGAFPSAAVFDGSLVQLWGSYIGGGCHDSPHRPQQP